MKGRVKELREGAHISQKSLGHQIGISQQVISRIERDARTMTLEHLLLLADYFNVSSDYILGRSMSKRNMEEQRVLLDKLQEKYDLIQIYDSLKQEQQEVVWSLMDVLVAKMETQNREKKI